MRISLEPDGVAFAKQVSELRKSLQTMSSGQTKVSANFLIPCWLPYLTALRTELRDDVVPGLVMTAAADLLANLAKTTVQSLMEAPPLIIGQTIEQLLMEATRIACQSLAQEAEHGKPRLAIVPKQDPGAKAPATVLHMQTKKKRVE